MQIVQFGHIDQRIAFSDHMVDSQSSHLPIYREKIAIASSLRRMLGTGQQDQKSIGPGYIVYEDSR
jgi:hypothetical protein